MSRFVAWLKGHRVLAAGVGAGVLAVVLITVSMFTASAPAAAATLDAKIPVIRDGEIHFPREFAEREHLSWESAEERVLTPNLDAVGEVTWDVRRVAAVGARIEGRIRNVFKVEGENVTQGEVLAELESVELGKAQAEVLKLRAREKVALNDAERERRLADARISAERDAEHARANAEALSAERLAAEKTVEALGGSMDGELGVLRLRAPLAGRVVEANVRRGETVEPSDTLFVIADPRRVWVNLSVFERDLPAIQEGDAVHLRAPAMKDARWEGQVSHVSEVIDDRTHSAEVRVELDNPDGRLRPGLSVLATIEASRPRGTHLAVPKTAVTRIDGNPTVFVLKSEGVVSPRQVLLGPEDATSVAVESGLLPGDKVVTQGVFALKAEVFR